MRGRTKSFVTLRWPGYSGSVILKSTDFFAQLGSFSQTTFTAVVPEVLDYSDFGSVYSLQWSLDFRPNDRSSGSERFQEATAILSGASKFTYKKFIKTNPSEFLFDAMGGQATYSNTAGLTKNSFVRSVAPDWITFPNGSRTLEVASNTGFQQRSAVLSVQSDVFSGISTQITVAQDAGQTLDEVIANLKPQIEVTASGPAISWNTIEGLSYQVKWNNVLGEGFPIPVNFLPISGDGSRKEIVDDLASGDPRRFYSVELNQTLG